jgi:hypothetical protein
MQLHIWQGAALALMLVAGTAGCNKRPETVAAQQASGPGQPAQATPAATAPAVWPFMDGTNKPAAGNPDDYLKRNYFFVLDGSGSMAERKCSGDAPKMNVAKQALLGFIDRIPAGSNVGGLVFDEFGVRTLAELKPKGDATWATLINGVRAGGGTPLATAVTAGYQALTMRAAAQLGYGEYHLVVVTDGEANQGEDPRAIVDVITRKSPIVVHTIGFCIGQNHSLNQPGKTVYRAADNPEDLERGLAEVLAEAPSFDAQSFK